MSKNEKICIAFLLSLVGVVIILISTIIIVNKKRSNDDESVYQNTYSESSSDEETSTESTTSMSMTTSTSETTTTETTTSTESTTTTEYTTTSTTTSEWVEPEVSTTKKSKISKIIIKKQNLSDDELAIAYNYLACEALLDMPNSSGYDSDVYWLDGVNQDPILYRIEMDSDTGESFNQYIYHYNKQTKKIEKYYEWVSVYSPIGMTYDIEGVVIFLMKLSEKARGWDNGGIPDYVHTGFEGPLGEKKMLITNKEMKVTLDPETSVTQETITIPAGTVCCIRYENDPYKIEQNGYLYRGYKTIGIVYYYDSRRRFAHLTTEPLLGESPNAYSPFSDISSQQKYKNVSTYIT